jgi:hypothetical protein
MQQQQLQGFRDELIQQKLEFRQLLQLTERQYVEISQLRSQKQLTQATLLQRACNLTQQEAVMILGNPSMPHLTHQNVPLEGSHVHTRTPAAAANSVTTPTRKAATANPSTQHMTHQRFSLQGPYQMYNRTPAAAASGVTTPTRKAATASPQNPTNANDIVQQHQQIQNVQPNSFFSAAQSQPLSSFTTLGPSIHNQTSMQSTAQSAFSSIPHVQTTNLYPNMYQPQGLQQMGQLTSAQSLTPNNNLPQ